VDGDEGRQRRPDVPIRPRTRSIASHETPSFSDLPHTSVRHMRLTR
jgi:hypothetical protein